ncbi:hypothetical protein GA0074694_2867 [Micromonospora inyonensis]|uniref:Uncharacterized protein n=1 Tax=Micromonospora inyonensis TaxID=47866 RepID=A0A1C6RRW9_9ACTN|nr:hypothetical protein GA0074694_2867 [Micromonospora inyonensis]
MGTDGGVDGVDADGKLARPVGAGCPGVEVSEMAATGPRTAASTTTPIPVR